MDRQTFEQLVSEWLDQPDRDDLRARIEAALAGSPVLERVEAEWLRLDRLVRRACPGVGSVDWPRLRHRIAQRLDSNGGDRGVDQRLRELTDLAGSVDWPRFQQRVSQAIDRAAVQPTVIRAPLRRVAAGIALLAAAAALVLMFGVPTAPLSVPPGFAQVRVSIPGTPPAAHEGGRPFARVTISAPAGVEAPTEVVPPSRAAAVDSPVAEVFLMVEPARLAGRADRQLIAFDFSQGM